MHLPKSNTRSAVSPLFSEKIKYHGTRTNEYIRAQYVNFLIEKINVFSHILL